VARAIVGTAGHIDHGKTALVLALTGVDTDRLPEEKARGITIDLGFAEMAGSDGTRMGVVDVPGHEDFVRTMVAGATGMDVVLLVVAADEGIMPQTREHLDIVRLLAVPRMVVALAKADLADEEWRALVTEEVRAVLADTPYADAPVVPTSCRLGTGIEELRKALTDAAAEGRPRTEDDLARLPLDRAFTVQGMGTVVTGTLWSGTLSTGQRIRILPGGAQARVRSIQVHGRDASRARAGERTALALAALDRDAVRRGQVVVADAGWAPGSMLTAHVRLLPGAARALGAGDRARVLLGTAEVMARCVLLDETAELAPGGSGWVQLRLEDPVLARAGDRFVLRTYSPVVTIGGGTVAEPLAPKRRRLAPADAEALSALTGTHLEARLDAGLLLGGWAGLEVSAIPQACGLSPSAAETALGRAQARGAVVVRGFAFAPGVATEAGERILEALDRGHAQDGLRASVPLERLREALPRWAALALSEGVVAALAREGALELAEGGARRPGFRPAPTPDQDEACRALRELFAEAGLAAPFAEELPPALGARADLRHLLRYLEGEGELRTVGEGLMVSARALDAAAEAIAAALGGRKGLGPTDFRDVLPLTRRHLMPLLAYFDGIGVTLRHGPLRDVPRPG
jgi:selenocysteine-specific elongation factor